MDCTIVLSSKLLLNYACVGDSHTEIEQVSTELFRAQLSKIVLFSKIEQPCYERCVCDGSCSIYLSQTEMEQASTEQLHHVFKVFAIFSTLIHFYTARSSREAVSLVPFFMLNAVRDRFCELIHVRNFQMRLSPFGEKSS